MNTEHTVGFGNSGRSSSRVLKPPVSLALDKNAFFTSAKKKISLCKKKSIKRKEKKKIMRLDDLISLDINGTCHKRIISTCFSSIYRAAVSLISFRQLTKSNQMLVQNMISKIHQISTSA